MRSRSQILTPGGHSDFGPLATSVSGFTPVATLAGVSSGDVIQVILDPDDPVATVTVA